MTLKATGKKDGKVVTLEYNGTEFTFNGERNELYRLELEWHINAGHYVGGTYYPPKNSDLNILNVVENYFFDRNAVAEVTGADIEPMESVDGRIY